MLDYTDNWLGLKLIYKPNEEKGQAMRSDTETIIGALRVLAHDIQSGDGVANAVCWEAADRLQELQDKIKDWKMEAKNERD